MTQNLVRITAKKIKSLRKGGKVDGAITLGEDYLKTHGNHERVLYVV